MSNVLVTGGTGFLGQAILERLLTDHPGTTITLRASSLIRGVANSASTSSNSSRITS